MSEGQVAEVFGKAVGNLFRGGPANVSWERALERLEASDAGRVPGLLPHSAAQIVAHVQFWQAYLLEGIAGNDPATPEHAAGGWPATGGGKGEGWEGGDWEDLKTSFLRDTGRLRGHARDPEVVQTLDREGRPYAVALTNFAGHNLYHLGQVVTVRQALGLWPPPGGGDTW
ncbi:DinB family protein [Deinococcus arenicola]|uniref:DinB family protein n=1 Tax=Deinococcus arenicola TaxID=2994950 RepID=A0ABU4DN21_9DEIO|nr:DinB family protein [Deinococcus sp. ZS9-10]MDV6373831.1 DinB family protein [Deinococcus sp. ZS9-10]